MPSINEISLLLSPLLICYTTPFKIENKNTPQKHQISFISPVENLNDYLLPFKHCFLHLINHRNVDLLQISIPLILSQIVTKNNKEPQSCPVSKYTGVAQYYQLHEGFCTQLNFLSFPSNSRPWNCRVNLSLLPQKKSGLIHLPSWNFDKISQTFSKMIPSLVPEINIFLIRDSDRVHWDNQWILDWMYRIVDPKKRNRYNVATYIDNSIFVLITIMTVPNAAQSTSIQRLRVLQTIENGSVTLFLDSTRINSAKEWFIVTGNRNYMEIWTLFKIQTDQYYSKYFQLCQDFRVEKKPWKNPDNVYLEDPLAYIFVHVWLSIFKNYTFLIDLNRACTNGRFIEINRNQEIKPLLHLSMRRWYRTFMLQTGQPMKSIDVVNELKFVSCGRPQMNSFAFIELVNVFDMYIWIFVGNSLIFLAGSIICMRYLSARISKCSQTNSGLRNEFLSRYFQLLKAFLEQGDSFSPGLLTKHKFRFVLGLFFLMAIVLSNAYKNSNVYNMVAPRKPIPYESLDQLIQGGFDIFTGAVFDEIIMQDFKDLKPEYVGIDNDAVFVKGAFAFYTEVSDVYPQYENDGDTVLNNLRKWTKLHTGVVSAIKHVHSLLFPNSSNISKNVGMRSEMELNSEAFKVFQNFQRKILLETLNRCNKTAIILSYVSANEFARRVQQQYRDKVYVGRESYFQREVQSRVGNQLIK
ncbi:unnamed protein product [Orchesella dallaii]|uniref:Uncharacterized protein n=1 Tax=Orchesella dallaii TaxID=48710 RepID=A0ABP1RQX2_9HEXA